jgi:hypothetical protein
MALTKTRDKKQYSAMNYRDGIMRRRDRTASEECPNSSARAGPPAVALE